MGTHETHYRSRRKEEKPRWEEPAQGYGSVAPDFTSQVLGPALCPCAEHPLLSSPSQGSSHLWVQYKLFSSRSTVPWTW